MRVKLAPCVLLHQRSYRESSLLLEVFSREHGRLGMVARGARRPRGGLRATLQPCRRLLLSWSLRGELATLTGAESVGAVWLLRGDALFAAFYLNELLIRLLGRQDPHPSLFDSYAGALNALEEGTLEPALRIFEKRLLQEIGYGLELSVEADGLTPIVARTRYAYRVERGAQAVGSRAPPPDTVVVHGATLQALHGECLEGKWTLAEAKALLRNALSRYTGPRPLQTPALLRAMRY